MTTLQTFIIILILGLLSCNNSESTNENKNTTSTTASNTKDISAKSDLNDTVLQNDTTKDSFETKLKDTVLDNIKRFIVDDYPVTYKMIAEQTVDNSSSYRKLSGKTQSLDKSWFTNDTLKQTLIFELYTDGHRLLTYHFLNNEIPNELFDKIELHTLEGDPIAKQQKKNDFKGLLLQSTKIDSKYFTTNKGLKLGDTQQKILKVYGKPHKRSLINGIEKLEWSFAGDILYDGKADLKGKPLAKDNYGHQAYLFFKYGKLIGLLLHNDIP